MTEEIIDHTLSKRPLKDEDPDANVDQLQGERERLAREIKELDSRIEAKQSPEWAALVKESYIRLCDIERKRMAHDPRDIPWHCQCVGQWNERFRLTQELLSVRREREAKVGQMESVTKRILKAVQKVTHRKG